MKTLALLLLTTLSATAMACPGSSEHGINAAAGDHGRTWLCRVPNGTMHMTHGVSITCTSFSVSNVSEDRYQLRSLQNPVVLF